MLKKKMNQISDKIYSIEYYDSIVVINIKNKKLKYSKNLQNNKKLATSFIDYRFKRVDVKNYKKNKNKFINVIKSKVSKKGYLQKIYEDYQIKKYLKKIKN